MKNIKFLLFILVGIVYISSCYDETPSMFIEDTGDTLFLKDTLVYFDSINIIDYSGNVSICSIKFIEDIKFIQISELVEHKCNIEYREDNENWEFEIFARKNNDIYFYLAFSEDLKTLKSIIPYAPFP